MIEVIGVCDEKQTVENLEHTLFTTSAFQLFRQFHIYGMQTYKGTNFSLPFIVHISFQQKECYFTLSLFKTKIPSYRIMYE